MWITKAWAMVAMAALAATFGLSGAQPAAADQTIAVNCATSADVDLVLVAGETLTVNMTNCVGVNISSALNMGNATINYECIAGNPGVAVTSSIACSGTPTGPGITRFTITVPTPVLLGTAAFMYPVGAARFVNVNSVAPPDTDTDAGSGGVGPSDVIQQVELPAGIGCAALSRPDLDWSGVNAGGWSESWAAWANAGRGGAICTRTLGYGPAGWLVR